MRLQLREFSLTACASLWMMGCSNDNWSPFDNQRIGPGQPRGYQSGYTRLGYGGMISLDAAGSQQPQTIRAMIAQPSFTQFDPSLVQNLQYSMGRVNDRRAEVDRVLQALAMEQQQFEAEVTSVNMQMEQNKRQLMLDYQEYLRNLQGVASMQVAYPREIVYVNSGQSYTQQLVKQPMYVAQTIQPIPMPQVVISSASPVPAITTIPPTIPPTTPPTTVPADIVNMPESVVVLPASTPVEPVTVSPQVQYVTPQTTPDYGGYTTTLLNFMETVNALSGAVSGVSAAIAALRSDLVTHQSSNTVTHSYLTQTALAVNSLLSHIKTTSVVASAAKIVPTGKPVSAEVWIDADLVPDGDDKVKLETLLFKEGTSLVGLTPNGGEAEEGSVSLDSVTVPSMFSLSVRTQSRHHRLRMFTDSRAKLVKLVAVCGIHKRTHKGEQFMLSFACDDTNKSFKELANTKVKNRLADAALKVLCHSKQFARRMMLEPEGANNRCNVSKWHEIAAGLVRPKFFALDWKGKSLWKSLVKGKGCFSQKESEISADCGKVGVLTRFKRAWRSKFSKSK